MENLFELILERLDRIEKTIQKLEFGESTNPVNELLDIVAVASYLKVSKSVIYKLTSTSEIPHYKNGKRLYFKKSEVDEWIFSNRIKTHDEIEKEAMEYIRKNPRR